MANALRDAVFITIGKALRVYGLIFGISPRAARDQLRSQAALEGALARPLSYQH